MIYVGACRICGEAMYRNSLGFLECSNPSICPNRPPWPSRVGTERSNIYVIANSVQRVCKIGRSSDPERRLENLRTGYPGDLNLYYSIPIVGNRALFDKVESDSRLIALYIMGRIYERDWVFDIDPAEAARCVDISFEINFSDTWLIDGAVGEARSPTFLAEFGPP